MAKMTHKTTTWLNNGTENKAVAMASDSISINSCYCIASGTRKITTQGEINDFATSNSLSFVMQLHWQWPCQTVRWSQRKKWQNQVRGLSSCCLCGAEVASQGEKSPEKATNYCLFVTQSKAMALAVTEWHDSNSNLAGWKSKLATISFLLVAGWKQAGKKKSKTIYIWQSIILMATWQQEMWQQTALEWCQHRKIKRQQSTGGIKQQWIVGDRVETARISSSSIQQQQTSST